MAHEKVHVICENLCLEEGMTKEQIKEQTIFYFNNVAAMKASDRLKNGMVVKTLGYYSANDGGSANYLIRTKTQSDVEDNGSIHFIGTNLVAELIVENGEVNVKQFGAKGDGVQDDTQVIKKSIEFADNIYIPRTQQFYLISSMILITENGKNIYGDTDSNVSSASQLRASATFDGNKLIAIQHNVRSCKIEDIILRGDDYTAQELDGLDLNYNVNDTTSYGYHTIRNIRIRGFSGNGLVCVNRSYDNYLDNITVSHCKGSGVIWGATDSTFTKVYSHHNSKHGFVIGEKFLSGANSLNAIKAYMNGVDGDEYYGIYVIGGHNRIVNANSQQNYGTGLVVTGDCNIMNGTVIDGNGYENINNNLASVIIAGNKNIISGIISADWTKGNTKYGLLLTKECRAANYIDFICDEFARTYGNTEKYINFPTMEDYIIPYKNANNKVIINNRNLFDDVQWEKLVGRNATVSHVTKSTTGDNIIVTPSDITLTQNGYVQISMTDTFNISKPVLLVRAKVKGFKPLSCNVNVGVRSTDMSSDTRSPKHTKVDLSTGGKDEYIYLAQDLTEYGITENNFSYAYIRFNFTKDYDMPNKGTNVIIENPEFCWVEKNSNYIEPVVED